MLKYWDEFTLLFRRYIFIKTTTIYDLLIHLGIIAVFSAVVVLFFFYSYLPNITHHRETVTVPDLQGMSVSEAEKFLTDRDLEYTIADSSFSKAHKPYTIITQSPEPGAKVKQSRKIRLTINPKNPPNVVLPLLTDMPFVDALRTLKNANLELGKIKYKPHIGENVVIEQYYKGRSITKADFEANTIKVPMGTKIDLLVGDGLGETEFNMPDLIGLSQEEAELVLKGSELVLGTINYDFKSRRELGTVVRQTPTVFVGKARQGVRAGSAQDDRDRNKVRAGDIIDLWVAGNPAAKPLKEGENEDDDLDPKSRRERDSLQRNINERPEDQIKNLLRRRKGEDTKNQPIKPSEKKTAPEKKE
jgi:eukaryotic-like serine/threonine-protein kinase